MELWSAMPKKEILTELFMAEQLLDSDQELLWYRIKISPEIWKCKDVIEDNFWVVAKTEQYIIWYNDIEEGFNISRFKTNGEFLQYGKCKNDLNFVLEKLKSML